MTTSPGASAESQGTMNETPDTRPPDPASAPVDPEIAIEEALGAHSALADRGARLLKPSGRRASTAHVPEAHVHPAVEAAAIGPPVFRCRDVSVFYGAKQALKGISLDVHPRRCWR